MTTDVKLCMQCIHHPASTRLVGVPCRRLGKSLAEARSACRGELWEPGAETPIARRWLRRPKIEAGLPQAR